MFVNQVGTVLLSCAFLYDIFWVFVSKKLFHESVMIVVSNPLVLLLSITFIFWLIFDNQCVHLLKYKDWSHLFS